jgi:DNA mismatch repair protein MSH5
VARRNSKQLWSVVFIPQVGFVISVSGGKLSEELLELLPDYKLAFMGEDGPTGFAGAAAQDAGIELDRGCAYYTCDGTQQLDSEFGDLQHKIQDLEVRHRPCRYS